MAHSRASAVEARRHCLTSAIGACLKGRVSRNVLNRMCEIGGRMPSSPRFAGSEPELQCDGLMTTGSSVGTLFNNGQNQASLAGVVDGRAAQSRSLTKNPRCAQRLGTAADFRVLGSTHLCSEPVYSKFSPATEHGLSIVYIKYIESVWVLSTPGQIRMWRNANDTV